MANKRINELALRTPQTTDLMLIGDPTTGYSYKTTLLSALNLGVPTTRTITINGTTFDLSANRTWSVGTVTSVGLTMPSAFNVASSPVTGSGTIAVTAAGLATQYIRGDGTLADFPGGGGGGGASVSYYLNGSVNQGTIGGVTYYEMNKTPILGAGTDFVINANGYIASFLTDAGDPALLKIPGGNWNTEFYFSASSGGGTPTYYLELYKYDGTTFTLIASSSSNPDTITGGTSVEQYFTTIPVPETVLTATDRLAIRIYVTHAGRTITLHTENSNLCQIITTFTTGLTALNGLTAQVQYFATGSAGTDFNISSSTATHTFNLPTASATNRGALSSADWTTFNNKVTSIIAGNAITVSNASGNVTVNHADTSGADPGATITGSNVFRSIVLDTYGHVTGLSYSSFLISDLGGTAISSPSNGQVLSYNGTNWVNSSLSGLSIITGSGTTNWVPKFTSASAIGLSNIYDGGSFIGVFTDTDNLSGAKLQVSGAATFSGNLFIGAASGSNTAGFTNRLYLEGNLPSLTLSNTGTNTGKFTFGVTNGNLGIWNNATSNYPLFINSSNNVGIGTASPSTTLHVDGNSAELVRINSTAANGSYLGFRNSSTLNVAIGTGSNLIGSITTSDLGLWTTGSIVFQAGGSVRMRLDSSGNLGLGVTPSAWRNLFTALQVGYTGALYATSTATASEQVNLASNYYQDSAGNELRIVGGNATRYQQASGEHRWSTAGSSTAGSAISFTQAMTLDASGRLGIGTTSPGVRFVNSGGALSETPTLGSATIGSNAILSANGLYGLYTGISINGYVWQQVQRNDANTSVYSLVLQPSGGRVLIGTTTDNTVDLLQVAGSGRFTGGVNMATTSGNVGIGTTSPAEKLDVIGGAVAAGNGTIRTGITYSSLGLIGTFTNHDLGVITNGTERMRITSGGEVYIAGTTDQGAYNLQCNGTGVWGAGAYVNGSDIRLKENISPIKTALEYVNKMNPISFKYKESYSKDQNIQPGFIAQELKELFKDEIWVNGIVSEGTDYLNVAYQNIIPLLTKAIQELKTELDTLKK